MGNITNDTFNPIRAYCNVRLQQGVPLVDADVNELDDIRKFEVRAFLKWIVGDGVPDGSDGFHILSNGTADGFTISAGTNSPPPNTTTISTYVQPQNGSNVTLSVVSTSQMSVKQYVGVVQMDGTFAGYYQIFNIGGTSVMLTKQAVGGGIAAGTTVATAARVYRGGAVERGLHFVGRIFVDGLDILIADDTTYPQALSTVDTQPPYSLAAVAPFPNSAGPVLVYLDAWERIVSTTEDPSLVVQPINTESCVRIKRLWVVRTRVGTAVPQPGDSDFSANHLYYRLASITLPSAGAVIQASNIADLREQGLSILSPNLIQDTMGESAALYRQGLGRPAVSLRDAINSLARGQVPGPAAQPLASPASGAMEVPGEAVLDNANGVIIPWGALLGGTICQIFLARLDLGNPSAGFGARTQITFGPTAYKPSAAPLSGGNLIVAWQTGLSGFLGNGDIFFKQGTLAALADPNGQVTAVTNVAPNNNAMVPHVVTSGTVAVFFFLMNTTGTFYFRRYDTALSNFIDAQPVQIPGATGELHAAVAPDGNIWLAFSTMAGVMTYRLPPSGILDTPGSFGSSVNNDYGAPYVLCAGSHVWAFWRGAAGGLWSATYSGGWGSQALLPYTVPGDNNPKATVDASGQIALAFLRIVQPGSNNTVFLMHGDPNNGDWLPPLAAVASAHNDVPTGLIATGGSMWVQWSRTLFFLAVRAYYRQLCAPL